MTNIFLFIGLFWRKQELLVTEEGLRVRNCDGDATEVITSRKAKKDSWCHY